MKVLVLNAGSSSQKSCLYDLSNQALPDIAPHPLWEAEIDWTHQKGKAELKVKTRKGKSKTSFDSQSRRADTLEMLKTLWGGENPVIHNPQEIDIVGHRVVHGGDEYRQSTFVTSELKAAIARLSTFAPIHNPVNLEGIESIEEILGDIPQVAVFDTAFHSHLTPAAYTYPIPYKFLQQGIRRYGFHGISHEYCARRAAQILGCDLKELRLITCHLGNGCSLAAIRDGYSVDTTMGFTPLEGLMMGSRSGSVDPGILLHLLRHENYTADELDNLLNRESGLLGISGLSGDLRPILSAAEEGEAQAKLALDIYIHRLRSCIGSMLASLSGLDAIIFTAGAGENSPLIRAATCEGFEFLGWKIDAQKNESSPIDIDIAAPESTVRILPIHTQEDWAIAQACWQLSSSDG
ncbi:acetate kinase [Rivularia sp. PCC 7116]|uniref:acetate kinase n=1 Tax=Rivularia sp. PCC 7116 TaxID=373994 RepID=UPI00029ED1E0|nr:acetate kinase [Rivularia sp. PCC 7116]AFY55564.1 acetate kinase [Rivularia sp. PCC 7116]